VRKSFYLSNNGVETVLNPQVKFFSSKSSRKKSNPKRGACAVSR